MDNLLEKMGWKNPYGSWDMSEVKADLGFGFILVVVISAAVYYG